jgi:MipA family protein
MRRRTCGVPSAGVPLTQTVSAVLAPVLVGCSVLLPLGLTPAHAADAAADASTAPGSKPSLWIVTLGGYATVEPKSEGSKTYHLTPRAIFNVRRSDEREWLQLPNDSFEYELIETDNFRAGPVVNGRWGNVGPATERGTRRVGWGDSALAVSLEAGAFAEYWPTEWLRTRVEVRAAAVGGSGVVAEVSSDLVWRPDKSLTLNAGPRLSAADGAFMTTYYGVNAQQAAAARTATFTADAGLRSYGFGGGFKYKFTPRLAGLGFVEYQRLAGSAGHSPVVQSSVGTANQLTVGLGLSYDFHLDW